MERLNKRDHNPESNPHNYGQKRKFHKGGDSFKGPMIQKGGGGGFKGGPRQNPIAIGKQDGQAIVSNSYRLSLSETTSVAMYSVSFEPPLETYDRRMKERLIRQIHTEICDTYGQLYVHSADNLYSTKHVNENVAFTTKSHGGQTYEIRIEPCGKLTLDTEEYWQKKTSVVNMFLNQLIKRALRKSELVQIGNLPRFYDKSTLYDIPHQNLTLLEGFRTSSYFCESGLVLTIDNVSKFLRTKTVLEEMQEMRREGFREKDIQAQLKGSTVQAEWGNFRTYQIATVAFDKNPLT